MKLNTFVPILLGLACMVLACSESKKDDSMAAQNNQNNQANPKQEALPASNITLNPPPEIPTSPVDWLSENMVAIEGGSFIMGCLEKNDSCCLIDTDPVHKVNVKGFKMCKYETPQLLWETVMQSNPSEHKNCPMCPVEMVNWHEAQTFIKKLNQKTGKNYRLLSEAEWEFAAKGGNKGHGYCYAGSQNADEVSWYEKNCKSSQIVGLLKPNEVGIYDLSGNVSEWVQDVWHDDYSGAPTDGSAWTKGGDDAARILKGGDWFTSKKAGGVSDREGEDVSLKDNTIGFRLAHD